MGLSQSTEETKSVAFEFLRKMYFDDEANDLIDFDFPISARERLA